VGPSPRLNSEDPEHVRLLAQAEVPLPPILVHRATMRVIDGRHRLRAAEMLGHEAIDVRFVHGTEAELLIVAVKANASHGLPLTLADREAAAARIIGLLPRHSDRWVAEATGLAPGTVAVVRRRSASGAAGPQSDTRIGKDGRERPVDIARRRLAASEAIIQDPGASLRAVARLSGLSPGTVRDVRQRLLRGEDVVARKPPGRERKRPGARAESGSPAGLSAPAAPSRGAAAGQARDRLAIMQDLRRDPSIRFTEQGRKLLESLALRAAGPSGLEVAVESLPAHCGYLIAALARKCAEEWAESARRMEQRLAGM
jgi:hypothetical protein